MNTKPWNIIFLDIDGVLATRKTKYLYFQKECVDELKRVLEETDARIVLSSAWRCHWKMEDLKAIFEDAGINGDLIVGATPSLLNGGRGTEISMWLRDNKDIWVKRYVIIDDEISDIKAHADRIVDVKTEEGFVAENADKAIQLLNPC